MEGLEVNEVTLSELLRSNEVFRIDGQYFNKTVLNAIHTLRARDSPEIRELGVVTDGIHTSLPFVPDGTIKVLSAQHPKNNFLDLANYGKISAAAHEANPRTALRNGDVIVSTVGTIGNAAVVTRNVLPANSDRHIGIIRSNPDVISPFYLATFLVSRYGRAQSWREVTGNVQPNLFISKIERLLVPRFSTHFEKSIVRAARFGYALRRYASRYLFTAEQILLKSLELETWQLPEALSYVRSSREAFTAGRLDAEYFDPAAQAILATLDKSGDIALGNLLQVTTGFPWKSGQFIESGDGDGNPFVRIRDCKPGGLWARDLDMLEGGYASGQGQPMAKPGDIVVGMDGLKWFYASQLMEPAYVNQRVGWLIQKDSEYPPEFVLTVINSLIGQQQLLARMTIAQTVGHITLEDLRELRIPELMRDERENIASKARTGMAKTEHARQMLDAAKRAVEIAIEQSEEQALEYLKAATEP